MHPSDETLRLQVRQDIETFLAEMRSRPLEAQHNLKRRFIQQLKKSPLAVNPAEANRQHYELPTEFFQQFLGKHLKYSCCYWSPNLTALDAAEEAMLTLTCERARLEDDTDILELGCGWGSLSLWMADHYPKARILAMSNSHSQRAYIQAQAQHRGLKNLSVVCADINDFAAPRQFDRIVSIEMFEHVKNYEQLLARTAVWLKPAGLLFVHIFSHTDFAYPFMTENPKDWMARTFFSGGTMPSDDLLLHFQRDVTLIDHWRIDGTHYTKTLEAWYEKYRARLDVIEPIIRQTYGAEHQAQWLNNWRMFFLVCAEAFGLRSGKEYGISHYLFTKKG